MSGSCSFCGKEAREIFGLAGVIHRNIRVCDECVNLCLEIIVENIRYQTSPAGLGLNSDADPVDERINDPELLVQLVRRLAASERSTG